MVSDDMKMEFSLDKCAEATFKRGKKMLTEGAQLEEDNVIQELESEATYTYLGIEDIWGTKHQKMKARSGVQGKDQTGIQV